MTESVDSWRATYGETGEVHGGRVEGLRRTFVRNGYVLLRDVVPKDLLSQLRRSIHDEFVRVRQTGALFQGGGVITGHLNCFPGAEARAVYRVLQERGVVDLVRTLSPRATGEPNVGCNLNLPRSVPQHYHTDGLFTDNFMIVNVPLVDTDRTNGAIDLLPGTHHKFYKYWRFCVEGAARRSTRVSMRQGDVLLRSSVLWHRGMPNHTPVPRPMLAFTWEYGGNAPPIDPFAKHDGKIKFLPNWYVPSTLGRLRERTFATAPITYATYRFIRSLFGNKGYSSW